MKKKVILSMLSYLLITNLYANDNLSQEEKIQKISQFYKNRLNNIKDLKIKFVEKNNDFPFESFVFEISANNQRVKEIVFVKDEYFFTDYVNFNTLESSREKASEILAKKSYKTILNELKKDKNYIISLGSGKNQIFIFSDPECPFCQKHLKNIDEKYLKENTLHFIFISIHNNFKITASLYKNLKGKATDKEKLEIINKYFFSNFDYEADEKDIQASEKIFNKYLNLGVNYTPFIIDEVK
ncbi:thioredoxin fold domain-containing protein [Campylobacter coli]|nr:thioredoxin fold domain-containing protein [Campylobacter coli]EHU5966116.1 thioredoxin fold domain-containing protein [Campylobacter coli]EKA0797339.1 thioredoxin fold domain-containing protein [Campylobacter coli]EKJ2090762.1 thioredoxin fold domain-containing protein [Campylobacter coli]